MTDKYFSDFHFKPQTISTENTYTTTYTQEGILDKINPDHYCDMPIQPLEFMQVILTKEEFTGFLMGNYIKYAMRAGKKKGENIEDDVKKAKRYKALLTEFKKYGRITLNKNG